MATERERDNRHERIGATGMREAVHCIGAALILTGCLGMTWMGLQLAQAMAQALHGVGRPAVGTAMVTQSRRMVKEAPKSAPFVFMSEAGDY